ncbi:AbiJ-NTD4 domain-containing protein [Desulfuribacillus alkaliarsenatis]|uniref:HEPN AbiJ-N-terminal domain-containing protein n=1 Tax=Desulfuribacillus alkaliarsenatis TaxID=766136 RepID=A0A1E5G025_9FIRM|nr:hypothetical protein [Desulfuribacillus alkaliarsenatis]OEF96164.1 hypothetical protein BHF68_08325 [Desulfuribacillus alkaliarsenatis]
MRFSQRYGYVEVRDVIQHECLDEQTRNQIWNLLSTRLLEGIRRGYISPELDDFSRLLWQHYFKKTYDTIPGDYHELILDLKFYFFTATWYEALDFIEAFPNYYKSNAFVKEVYCKEINTILEKENSAYRFVNTSIVEITNQIEIDTIESAFRLEAKYKSVRIHLETALELLADKENPDYRNSVKESVSAVESMCKILTGDAKATLGKTLDKLESTRNLHTALKESYKKLYGYSSDADGIRHALSDVSTVKYKDAIYMLINCSSFINYLRADL